MKIWLIYQRDNVSDDAFTSAVVVAETERDAANMHPDGCMNTWFREHTWCSSVDSVKVLLIGEAEENIDAGVILASNEKL